MPFPRFLSLLIGVICLAGLTLLACAQSGATLAGLALLMPVAAVAVRLWR